MAPDCRSSATNLLGAVAPDNPPGPRHSDSQQASAGTPFALRGLRDERLASGSVTVAGAIFAHQGGWDEILMVLGPLAILFVILLLANKRARKLAETRDNEDPVASAVDAHTDASPPSPPG
jgi:hypothetical protein